jgi:hypothetical protein
MQGKQNRNHVPASAMREADKPRSRGCRRAKLTCMQRDKTIKPCGLACISTSKHASRLTIISARPSDSSDIIAVVAHEHNNKRCSLHQTHAQRLGTEDRNHTSLPSHHARARVDMTRSHSLEVPPEVCLSWSCQQIGARRSADG